MRLPKVVDGSNIYVGRNPNANEIELVHTYISSYT